MSAVEFRKRSNRAGAKKCCCDHGFAGRSARWDVVFMGRFFDAMPICTGCKDEYEALLFELLPDSGGEQVPA